MTKKDYSIQPKVTAVDSETVLGKVVLLCTPKRFLVLPKTFEEIAHFLINTSAHEAHHVATFNLTYDATAIMKFLPLENLKEIYEDNETAYNNYCIKCVPSKFFSISENKRNGHKVTLIDIAQFFNGMGLDTASKTYLDQTEKGKDRSFVTEFFKHQTEMNEDEIKRYNEIEKDFVKTISKEQLNEIYRSKTPEELYKYLELNKDELIKYCQKDAYLTAELMKKVDQSCYETMGFRLETYTSNAKIGEVKTLRYLEKKFDDLGLTTYYKDSKGYTQKGKSYPRTFPDSKSFKFAVMAYRGGIFETWKRGVFEKVTDIDIQSAYPWVMVDLPHWSNGSFIELTAAMINDIENNKIEALYGWVLCEFDCSYIPYDSKIKETIELLYNDEPIELEVKNNKIYYPMGKREQVITMKEYYFLKKYNFPVRLLCGYIWKEKPGKEGNKYPKPFGWIKDTYNKKLQIKKDIAEFNKTVIDDKDKKSTKKDMNYLQCKISMNGAYGKSMQRKGGNNRPLYNPFYASYITAGCRVRIMEFILENNLKDKVINIATDGVLLEGIHNIKSSDELGAWEVNYWDNALVIGNGMLQLSKTDKTGKKEISSRLRGLTNNQKLDIKTVLEGIKNETEWISSKRRPLHLGEFLIQIKKRNIGDLNCFVKFSRRLRLNTDERRKWPVLKNFGELLSSQIDSKPLTVRELEQMYPVLSPEEKLTKASKTMKRLKKEKEAEDLFDWEAYHDSTLSSTENKKLHKDLWKDYVQ